MSSLTVVADELDTTLTKLLLDPLTSVAYANHTFATTQRALEDERNTVYTTVYVSKINPDQVLSAREYKRLGSETLYTKAPTSGMTTATTTLDFTRDGDRVRMGRNSLVHTLDNAVDVAGASLLPCGRKEYCFDARRVRTLRSTDYSQLSSECRHSTADKVAQPSSHLLIDKCRYKLHVSYAQGVYELVQNKESSTQSIELEVECVAGAPDTGGRLAQEKLAQKLTEHNTSMTLVDSTGSGVSVAVATHTRRVNKLKDVILRLMSLIYDSGQAGVAERRLYAAMSRYIRSISNMVNDDAAPFANADTFNQQLSDVLVDRWQTFCTLAAEVLGQDETWLPVTTQKILDRATLVHVDLGAVNTSLDWDDMRLFARIDKKIDEFSAQFTAAFPDDDTLLDCVRRIHRQETDRTKQYARMNDILDTDPTNKSALQDVFESIVENEPYADFLSKHEKFKRLYTPPTITTELSFSPVVVEQQEEEEEEEEQQEEEEEEEEEEQEQELEQEQEQEQEQ